MEGWYFFHHHLVFNNIHICRSTLIGVLSYGYNIEPDKLCNPADKVFDVYARITEEVVKWIRDNTKGAKIKKSNCDDIFKE